MKNILLFVFTVLLAVGTMAQNVALKFTGKSTTGEYIRLDSVKIESISRSWKETIIYPDTMLTFNNDGIDEVTNNNTVLKVFPNPFNGKTKLSMQLLKDETISLQIFNLNGQKITEFSQNMEAGEYVFNIRLKTSQTYLAVLSTSRGKSTLKLVNQAQDNTNSISLESIQKNIQKSSRKAVASHPFQVGDVLRYIGYTTVFGKVYTSHEIIQPQSANENFTLFFTIQTPTGLLNGLFSVAPGKQVRFSQGNLQWSATGGGKTATTHTIADGGTAAGIWRFAEHQWDYVGDSVYGNVYVNDVKCDNSKISSDYNGWIDLFGLGTSGYNNKHPYMTSTNDSDYGNGDKDLANTNYDWGVYNAISNGSNIPNKWRTLTKEEWLYLIYERKASNLGKSSNAHYALVKLGDVNGAFLFPDVFSWPKEAGPIPSIIDGGSEDLNDWSAITSRYTIEQFSYLEQAGVVFLPITGERSGTSTISLSFPLRGTYRLITITGPYAGAIVAIQSTYVSGTGSGHRHTGYSVRLVQDY